MDIFKEMKEEKTHLQDIASQFWTTRLFQKTKDELG